MRTIIAITAILAAGPAFASETTVSLPWGDWAVELATVALSLLGTVLTGYLVRAAAYLPDWIGAETKSAVIGQVEQLLDRAIGAGINATKGAMQGQTLSADIGLAVAADAVNYAIAHGPKKLIDTMGGAEGIRQKILARLDLDADAAVK